MIAAPVADPNSEARDAALSRAALQLMTAAPDDAACLARVKQLLSPLTSDPAEPAWVRQALATGVELLEKAVSGSLPHDGAIARVSALLELVMQGEPTTGTVAESQLSSFTLPDDAARELFPDFIAESRDYLDQTEGALLQLETDVGDAEAINVVFRAFHTIKSTSSFLGLEPISQLAHSAESVLIHIRDGHVPFDSSYADLTLLCADVLRELLAEAQAALDGDTFTMPVAYAPLMKSLAHIAAHAGRVDDHVGVTDASPEPVTAASAAAHRDQSAADDWMRVRTPRLDQLIDLIGELVVAHSMVAQDATVEQDRHGALARKVAHAGKIVRELQGLGMALRMVPLRPVFQKMQRLARDVAREAGKPVELATNGEDTEIDRNMFDYLADPLVHMIRNAIDHGIETPQQRAAAGKEGTGRLTLSAWHEGNDIVVELSDDGRGLDYDRICQSARERGLLQAERELSHTELCSLIFAPGLSTAAQPTALSGRGVGMDVVRRNVEALRGRIDVRSAHGQGTTFTLRLPLTLALTEGMLVRVGAEQYVVPTAQIQLSFRPAAGTTTGVPGAGEVVTRNGSIMPIIRLHDLYGIPDAVTDPSQGILIVIAEGTGTGRYALLVDELLGQQQFVVKRLSTALAAVPGVCGSAILGDGRVGLILDTAGVVAAR